MVATLTEQESTVSINTALSVLLRQWNSVDAMAKLWGQLESYEKVAEEMEWRGIVNALMKQMDRQQDDMTPAQKRRYDEVLMLADQKQSLLDKMFAS